MTINEALGEFFKEEDFYNKVIESSLKMEPDDNFDEYIKTLDNIYGESLKESIQRKLEKTKDDNIIIESIGVL